MRETASALHLHRYTYNTNRVHTSDILPGIFPSRSQIKFFSLLTLATLNISVSLKSRNDIHTHDFTNCVQYDSFFDQDIA